MPDPVKITTFATILTPETVKEAITQIDELDGQPFEVDFLSYGGMVDPSWTLAKRIAEHEGETTVNVDGQTASMGTALLPFFDNVRGANTAHFHMHAPVGGDPNSLKEVANELYKTIASKVDEDKFLKLTKKIPEFAPKGVTLKQLLTATPDKRINLELNAKQAKQVGLIDEIYNITPDKRPTAQVNEIIVWEETILPLTAYKDATTSLQPVTSNSDSETKHNEPTTKNNDNMTINEFKAQHPELYAEVLDVGKKDGIEVEKQRVASLMKYAKHDEELVKERIANGEACDVDFVEKIMNLGIKKATAQAIENGNAEDLTTSTPKTDQRSEAGKPVEGSIEAKMEAEGDKQDLKALTDSGISEDDAKKILEEDKKDKNI